MTVYLRPPQTNQFPIYPPGDPNKRTQNGSQTRRLWTDENATPLRNGSPNYSKMTIMHRALKNGNGKKAWEWLKKPRPFSFMEQGESKLVLAIKNCPTYPSLIHYLISGAHPKLVNYTTHTNALIEAAKLLDEPLVKRLLIKRADPNICATSKTTPLDCAIRVAGTIEFGKLASAVEEIQLHNEKLFSVVRTLLQNKASVDTVNLSSHTPLQVLFNKILPQQISPPLVSLLIENGANPENVSFANLSPNDLPDIQKAIAEGKALNKARKAIAEGKALNEASNQTLISPNDWASASLLEKLKTVDDKTSSYLFAPFLR